MDDNAGNSTGDSAGNSRARGEPFGRAPRSARPVAAGYRTFRRRCRFNSPTCCSRQARYYRHFTCRRRLPLAARLTFLGSRDSSALRSGPDQAHSAVADNTLTIKQKSTLPVSKTRQDKSLFCSLLDTSLPPAAQSRSHQPPIAQLSVAPALLPPRPHGLPPHLRLYYPPPASACARHPFYMTTCAAATAACGPVR